MAAAGVGPARHRDGTKGRLQQDTGQDWRNISSERLHHLETASAEARRQARGELAAGQKRGHWIWWVFPTLATRGGDMYSAMQDGADLSSVAEARAYAHHPPLRAALIEQFRALEAAMSTHGKQAPYQVLDAGFGRAADGEWVSGPVDSFKVFCCATLFAVLAHEANDEPLRTAAVAVLGRFTGDVVYSAGGLGTSGYLQGSSTQRYVLKGFDPPTLWILGEPSWKAVANGTAATARLASSGSVELEP
mmetsp:Transcript_14521/g.29393  ORF Transcript_14521/g.29393 Transcript_14521/m.29393 type:complete len:248 (+) Transcript_14521:18-761(+)|eukprot:CAMPEP_0119092504 /NCGR_PEP_ID=MMETSP1178-20130426/160029_1 /TAXON_ID=33656 /ORGANISM="unid sp, Strain CCMP2000" /LENGTH=247 /DNA_ID=CAMNT_0007076089 /DNA_START=18 /DNA_END=761 /DNA_ORIENTATION=+